MKLFFYYTKLSLVLFSLLFVVSCDDDEAAVPSRDDFLGTYSVVEFCDGDTRTFIYDITITASTTDENKVILKNLNNINVSIVEAIIVGNSLILDETTIDIGGGLLTTYIDGIGILSGNVLTINHALSDRETHACELTCTKK